MKSFLEKQIEKQKMLKERYQSTLTKYQIDSIHQISKFPKQRDNHNMKTFGVTVRQNLQILKMKREDKQKHLT